MKLRTLLLITTAICLALGGCLSLLRQVTGPVIPDRLLNQLEEGTPAVRVEELLGPPAYKRHNDPAKYSAVETWVYERPMNPGWVECGFDSEGALLWINDESVIPRHQR